MALRGHATIQGSTDIATLYNILPGYLPMPDVNLDNDTWDDYVKTQTADTGWWNNFPKYITSLFKAWYGEAFDPARGDEVFEHFPRLSGDYSFYPTIVDMKDGDVKGCFVFGQNFAVGGPHVQMAQDGLRNLDWLVVLDAYEIETATAWKMEGVDPEECATEVFFIPSALVAEKDGSFTQTQRMLQWHDKAVEPPGDARSDAWFVYHLGRRIKELYKDSEEPRDKLIQAMTWDYPTEGEREEPHIESVLKEISGYTVADGEPVSGFADLEDDGTTACGGWIYSGAYAEGINQPRRRKPRTEQPPAANEWGWAWPADRRILYNRASADPEGQALVREEKVHLVGRGAGQVGRPRRPRLHGDQTARTTSPTLMPKVTTPYPETGRSSSTATGSAGSSPPWGSPTARSLSTTSPWSRRSPTCSTTTSSTTRR